MSIEDRLMKLYHATASPNSRRVRMFMAEKGISIPLQPVNLAEKEQFSDRFNASNPRQHVPVLGLDARTTIPEVPAIWRFLEETHPQRPLLGSDAAGTALVCFTVVLREGRAACSPTCPLRLIEPLPAPWRPGSSRGPDRAGVEQPSRARARYRAALRSRLLRPMARRARVRWAAAHLAPP